jgi:serine/threonine-protein kinase
MGIVFKGHHIFLKTSYAIKVILPDLVGNDPMLVTRFRQEAMVAARIRHRNIVNVTDFGVANGSMPYLVMDFIKGRSLQEVLAERGRLTPEHALEIMAALCAGIGAAHKQEIIHRDLKPSNIMVQDDVPLSEGVKILDFGMAKIKSYESFASFPQMSGVAGSPFYMAPEQWADEELDARADIYSLGVILYQMLSGEVPFKGATIPAIMSKHLTLPPPSFQSKGLSIPPAIEAVVRHALEKDLGARIDSVESFMKELSAVRNEPGAVTLKTTERHMDLNPTTIVISENRIDRLDDSSVTSFASENRTEENRFSEELDRYVPEVSRIEQERMERAEAARRSEQERLAQARAARIADEQMAEAEAARRLEEQMARARVEVARRMAEERVLRQDAPERTTFEPTVSLYLPDSAAYRNDEGPDFAEAPAPARASKSSIAAIGIAAIAIPIAAVAAIPMLVKEGFEQVSDRIKKSGAAIDSPHSPEKLSISIAHPKLLSKRFSSPFLVQIYLPEMRGNVSEGIRQFVKKEPVEYLRDSELVIGQEIRLKFYSLELAFSDPVVKKLDNRVNVINFIAKPHDTCHPGTHHVLLSIADTKTNAEYQSIGFSVEVRDYAFDHLARPLLSKLVSATIGIGSLVMFILTLLGQIDTTLGLASGTVAGTLASGIYVRFASLYQQPKATIIPGQTV